LAEASDDIKFSTAEGVAEAIAKGTVTAFSASEAEACGSGVGSAKASADALAKSILKIHVKVCALALAQVGKGGKAAVVTVQAIADFDETTIAISKSSTEVNSQNGNCELKR